MKSFEHYIAEAKKMPRSKGWIHKSGKWNIWPHSKNLRPYHVEGVVKDPKKYGLTEKKIKEIIAKGINLQSVAVQQPAQRVYDALLAGRDDVNKAIYQYLFSKGWVKVVLGGGMHSLEGLLKNNHKVAKLIDKKYGEKSLFPKHYDFMEISDEHDRQQFDINNIYDWGEYLKTGKEPGKGRTEIGSTMAQFREEKMAICGMCFKWANDWNMKHHKGGTHKVVHGVVTNIKGKTFPHAWIEDKGKAYDVHSGEKGIVLNRYYKLLDPQDVVKYTPTKATQTLVRTRHHGPWDKKFDKWPTT